MMLFIMLFLIIRDIYLVSMVGAFSIAFGAVYLYLKDRAKNNLTSGRDVLDAQLIVGDLELDEQIAVRDYSYVVLPQKTISGKDITYSRIDIDDSLGTLRTVPIRVGGTSELRPEVVENLVRLRLRQLKEVEKDRQSDKKEKSKDGMDGRSRRGAKKIKEIPRVVSDDEYTSVEDYAQQRPVEPAEEKVPEVAEIDEYDGIKIDDIIFDEREGQ